MTERAAQRDAALDDLLGLFEYERRHHSWVGLTPDWYGPVVFGGLGLALTIGAACRDAPVGCRLHSIHGHFLRPVRGGSEIVFDNDVVKAGRSVSVHRTTASQDGKAVIMLTGSFTTDTDGYVYDLAGIPDGVPFAHELPEPDNGGDEIGPWDVRWLGPSDRRDDGTREATHRHWFRLPRALADDPHLHVALLGYATDWTGVGGRPHHLDGDTTGMISLDHAAWFHRPARVDEWLLQDVQSLVNAGGRGTLRGVIRDTRGRIVASMAQEMLLQPVTRSTCPCPGVAGPGVAGPGVVRRATISRAGARRYHDRVTDAPATGVPAGNATRDALVQHLGELGAPPGEIEEAIRSETVPELVRNYTLWGRVPDMSIADIARVLGVKVEKVRRVACAAGFTYDVDERVFVRDDVAMFTSFVEGSAFFEPELLLRYSRMLGDAAARVAEGSVSLFLRSMAEPEPGSADELALEDRAIAAIRVFRESVPRTVERMMLHHFVIAAERFATIRDSQHTVEAAVGFVDLTDSTGLSVDYGVRVVEPALAAFEMSAADAAASRGGRLVKLIGDAAMFVTPEAEGAVEATAEIVGAVARDERLRGARGGVTFGELLHRDGDYFGDPVNLAARLANAARNGTLLVDGAVAKRIGDRAVSDGLRHLEGFSDPVEVFRVLDQ